MKDYSFYLWMAYLTTLSVLLINLIIPLTRYYKLLRKKAKNSSISKKQC
ncbi:MAG: heme exporter protein CcmD [Pseudomonadota bacterium]